jgi:FkbM family methyltransferase
MAGDRAARVHLDWGDAMKHVSGWAFPDADMFMAAEMKADGSYQRSHFDMALRFVTDFSFAIDGGAHVGTWSRLLNDRFLQVLACEPSLDTYEALVTNMHAFDCRHVITRQCALGAAPGFVSMAPLEPRAAMLKNTGARFVQNGGSIPRITIDSLELVSLGFLKLDIEGSEPLALTGAADTLQRCRPIVLFEQKGFAVRYQLPKDAAQQVLTGVGYHELAIAGCDRIWGPR